MKEGRPRKGAPLLLLELLLHRLTDGHLPHGGPRVEGGLTVRLDGDTAWRGLEVVHLLLVPESVDLADSIGTVDAGHAGDVSVVDEDGLSVHEVTSGLFTLPLEDSLENGRVLALPEDGQGSHHFTSSM